RLFRPIVPSGTRIGETSTGISVIAPACHDTGSAVAAISMSQDSVFLSSGTWSLLGAEVAEPVITPLAHHRNFTNEGGVCGSIRLLKNIAGLWLLQSCRRCWPAAPLDELLTAAGREPALRSLFDPDDSSLVNPPDMPSAIASLCARTGQAVPESPA